LIKPLNLHTVLRTEGFDPLGNVVTSKAYTFGAKKIPSCKCLYSYFIAPNSFEIYFEFIGPDNTTESVSL
jgi:hypothetical protein